MRIEIKFKEAAEYGLDKRSKLFSGHDDHGFTFQVYERPISSKKFEEMFATSKDNRQVFVTDDEGGFLYAGHFMGNGYRLEEIKEAQKIVFDFMVLEIGGYLEKKRAENCGAIW